jgi:hypothetical protein
VNGEEARAYLARWHEVAAIERAELAAASLDTKVAQFASLWGWRDVLPPTPATRDESIAARWARIRACCGD